MLGYYRQASGPVQRKYARLGDDLGGHCVFVGVHRKAPNIACNAFYIVWYPVWGKALKRKEGAILTAWCDCSIKIPHSPACYRLDRGACLRAPGGKFSVLHNVLGVALCSLTRANKWENERFWVRFYVRPGMAGCVRVCGL